MRQSVRRLVVLIATITLAAAGLVAAATSSSGIAAPASVNFGTVPVGTTETIGIPVTITPGYSFLSWTETGDFANWPSPPHTCLGSTTDCTVQVTFAPVSTGTTVHRITWTECPTAGGACQNTPTDLTGTGGGPVTNGTMTASPTSAAPGGTFQAASTTPCPTGTANVKVQLVDSGGALIATHAGFLSPNGNWGGTVAVPANAAPGAAFVTALCDNGHGTTLGEYNFVPVTISAAAPTPAAFSASPSSLAYGTVPTGKALAATVTVTNTGGSTLTFTSVSITAGGSDFKITSNNCSGALTGGSSCQTTVTFKPVWASARTGTLTYVDSAGRQTIGLSGRGCVFCG